jgi:hypothetical protein
VDVFQRIFVKARDRAKFHFKASKKSENNGEYQRLCWEIHSKARPKETTFHLKASKNSENNAECYKHCREIHFRA